MGRLRIARTGAVLAAMALMVVALVWPVSSFADTISSPKPTQLAPTPTEPTVTTVPETTPATAPPPVAAKTLPTAATTVSTAAATLPSTATTVPTLPATVPTEPTKKVPAESDGGSGFPILLVVLGGLLLAGLGFGAWRGLLLPYFEQDLGRPNATANTGKVAENENPPGLAGEGGGGFDAGFQGGVFVGKRVATGDTGGDPGTPGAATIIYAGTGVGDLDGDGYQIALRDRAAKLAQRPGELQGRVTTTVPDPTDTAGNLRPLKIDAGDGDNVIASTGDLNPEEVVIVGDLAGFDAPAGVHDNAVPDTGKKAARRTRKAGKKKPPPPPAPEFGTPRFGDY